MPFFQSNFEGIATGRSAVEFLIASRKAFKS